MQENPVDIVHTFASLWLSTSACALRCWCPARLSPSSCSGQECAEVVGVPVGRAEGGAVVGGFVSLQHMHILCASASLAQA